MPSPSNYVVTVKTGVTGLSLPGVGSRKSAGAVVELTPHQFLQMSAVQLSKVTVTQTPSTGGLSSTQIDAIFATDTALATETSRAQAAEALAQPAATAATDAEVASALLKTATVWTANTQYAAGQWVITPGGYLASAKTSFTSSTTYSPSNWTEFRPGGELAYAENIAALAGGASFRQSIGASGSYVDVTSCTITLGPTPTAIWLEAEYTAKPTTAAAASTEGLAQIAITDETNTVVGTGEIPFEGGNGVAGLAHIRSRTRIPALATSKTFRVQAARGSVAFVFDVWNGNLSAAYRSYIAAFSA